MKFRKLFVALFVFVAALYAVNLYAVSGRESTLNPPQSIDIESASEGYGHQVRDIDNNVRFRVLPDGTIVLYNSSGATTWAIDSVSGQPIISNKASYLILDTETEAEAQSSAYDVLLIDLANYSGYTSDDVAGVSVYLPVGSEAMDGFQIKLVNIAPSGTTDVIVVPANDAFQGDGITDYIVDETGTTATPGGATREAFSYNMVDATMESITYVYRYAVSGGTWYQIDSEN